ncbi:MAG: radical SAM protein [Planctomycetota bacterium]
MRIIQEEIENRGVCSSCDRVVPAKHVIRGTNVFLSKECPDCGTTEALVSTDAVRYEEKRKAMHYEGKAQHTCSLNCTTCTIHKKPTLVFIDVTNRCNMNCPICLANIPAMGFRFDPPMEYFEKIFQKLAQLDPKPKIELFGGEPTMRKDLIEMIRLARSKYGLSTRVVTNGLRLADEKYCDELLATRPELMFSFDGRHEEIYSETRKHPRALELKTKALENVAKHPKGKVTIMCCVSDANEKHMADLIAFCHENRHCVKALDLIPLTAEWGPDENLNVKSTTTEGVEMIMKNEIPGISFFPAGAMFKLQTLRSTFEVGRMTFGGAHPNCELVSVLISDGLQYHPASKYLKDTNLEELILEAVALDEKMGRELESDPMVRLFGRKGRQFVFGKALLGLALRHVDLRQVFGGNAYLKLMRILFGLVRGVKLKVLLRKHTKCQSILRMIVLPFEDKECVEAARLVDCPASFAFENPKTQEVAFMPVCAWPVYKNEILRRTADRYGVGKGSGTRGLSGQRSESEVEC